jgi:succinate-semialdehyde dehydrogenase/glutarate-semialdehyde dehydrogenase
VIDTSISALLSHFSTFEATVPLINPANGKRVTDVPQQSADTVVTEINKLRLASKSWAATNVRERAAIIARVHDIMQKNQDKLLDVLQLETGKSRAHAFEEFAGATGAARYYGKHAPKFMSRKKTGGGIPLLTRTWIEHEPVGVVGIITPWNYPMALTMLDVLPALAAGNTVVQKADNQTPLSVLFCRLMAIEAGLPEDVWTVVIGDGATVGNAITDHVDYVAFTGSTNTGRAVAERASRRLIGYSLELGGKNPMIVIEGANPASAAELTLAAAFGSAGQLCVSTERVYVHNSIRERYIEEVVARTSSLSLGKTGDFDTDLGTLTSKAQFDRVSSIVDDARAHGAKILTGGVGAPELGPFFFRPTVVTDLNEDARLYKHEAFGPIIAVEGYDHIEDAIAKANDTEYGLNASVVGPEAEAIKVASQLKAGSVNVNEGYRASFASMGSPMGGMKSSGMGRRNGEYGLLRFTDTRTVGVAKTWFKLPSRGKHYKKMAPLMGLLSKFLKTFG